MAGLIFKSIATSCSSMLKLSESKLLIKAVPVFSFPITQRQFARWTARKPSKVELPEEALPTPDKSVANSQHVLENEIQQPLKPVHAIEDKEYINLKEDDTTFSQLMIQAGSRNERRKHRLMMLEGKRLNQDAINAGLKPHKLFFTQKSYLSELTLPKKIQVSLFRIPYKTMKVWSKLESPPGVVGFYTIPKESDIQAYHSLPVRVLCDNVREPGNLGAILRVAASVGCTEVILMKGCTDPWDSKVLRSASGGHFHIPIRTDMSWSEQTEFLQPADSVFLADSKFNRPLPPRLKLPQTLYYDTNYTALSSLVVVVGGETEGVSEEAYEAASQHNGARVYIPLSNRMDSLNTGSALSVVLFEIKRQFLVKESNKIDEQLPEKDNETVHYRSVNSSL